MADKDLERDGPSLELPSWDWRRRLRRGRDEPSEPASPPVAEPPAPPAAPPPAEAPRTPRVGRGPATSTPAPADADTLVDPALDPPDAAAATEPDRGRDPDAEREPRWRGRELRLPDLAPLPAVLSVGAAVGVLAVLLTWGSLRLCDVATGTATCGGGPGLLLLVAILITLTYLGGWLLRELGLPDADSTSALAVGLLAVVSMLFLLDSLDEWSGVLMVPVLTIAAYALSWRVTRALVDAGDDQP